MRQFTGYLRRKTRLIFRKYESQILYKNPVKTKMITTFFIFCAGDLTCQIIMRNANKDNEIKKVKLNYQRTLHYAIVAGGFSNPLNQLYMRYVTPSIKLPESILKTYGLRRFLIMQNWYKAIAHNAILSSIVIVSFLWLPTYLRTGDPATCRREVETKFKNSFIFHNSYWPGVTFLAYHSVPHHLRLLFFDAFGFIYSVGLSLVINMNMTK